MWGVREEVAAGVGAMTIRNPVRSAERFHRRHGDGASAAA